jgi:hypothetical protein
MKIYFAGSISGGRDDGDIYKEIIAILSKFGEVLTEHVGDGNLTRMGEDKDLVFIRSRDMKWIEECDVLVAEVTVPSLGVGYEVRDAEVRNKKVVCIHRPMVNRRLSAMISGSPHPILREYKEVSELHGIFQEIFRP